MRFAVLSFILAFCCCISASGQEIQNGLSYRHVDVSQNYFRVNYENDLLFHTDYFYTQGVHFELVSNAFDGGFFRKLFPLGKKDSNFIYRNGIGLESAGYTPMSIVADSILRGDRPFAGMAYAKLFSIAINSEEDTRITSTLSLGWMGPAAGGYEIQEYIHKHTGNPDPVGWKYQTGNSPIINYEVDYERCIAPLNLSHYALSIWGMARAGTLSNKAGIGAIVNIGWFSFPFASGRSCDQGDLSAYVYAHPEIDIVGYDATLQGGPFTRDNPYTIAANDISRITFRMRAGAVLGYRYLTAGISMRYLTKEFVTGRDHLTGGIDIAYSW